MDLKGKTALVTGASSGIGEAIAKKLQKAGAEVLWTSRNINPEVGKLAYKADLTVIGDINMLIDYIKERIKKVDIFVHAAAIWHTEDKVLANMNFDTFTEEEITSTLAVGILAPMLLINKLIPIMSKGSKIVNITGTFESGGKGWIPYFVSKQALEKLTEGLAQEFKEKDIQVNAISPSDTLTDAYKKFFPEEAIPENCVTPEQVAEEVLKFCDPDSKVTGEIRVVKK